MVEVEKGMTLVQIFNEAIKEHPLEEMGPYYVRNADLDENERKRRDKQMEHFLQSGDTAYLTFSFEGGEEKEEKLNRAFLRPKYTTDEGKIYYVDSEIEIGKEKNVWYYLRYDKRMHTFEIGVWGYPKSKDDEVIEMMRESLTHIDNIFNSKDINELFGMRRG
ncbi:MAG: hypothetical protein QXK65_03350 [Candidatus Micrarchaeaceae archaeon]